MGLTRLSLEVNVNYATIKRYIDLLTSQGLIAKGEVNVLSTVLLARFNGPRLLR